MVGAAMDIDGEMSEDDEYTEPYDSHLLGYNPHVQNGGYDPQLENVRMESIRKIRGRFEHIYQKYGKDFEGVGDEIDMTTGVVVVNNGHLQNMEHEVDAGNGDALALSRTFEDEFEDDEDEDDDAASGSDSEPDADQNAPRDASSVSSDNQALDFSWQEDTAASFTSPDEDGDIPINASHNRVDQLSTPKNAFSRKGQEHQNVAESTYEASSTEDTASEDILGGLKDSMLAMQNKYKDGQDMAPGEIEALGMSIANQLASLIAAGKGSKKRKRQNQRDRFESAERSRGRRRHRSNTRPDPVAPTPARSPGSRSLWAPLQQPTGRRGRKPKNPPPAPDAEAGDDSLVDSIVLQTIMHQSALEPDELQGPTTVRSCTNCKVTETLSWRKGPKAVDLCNNCGMYYYRYGLMRPLHKAKPKQKSPIPEEVEVDPRMKRAPYSANTSRPLDGINLFGHHFSVREDAQLIKLKEIDRLSWDQIAIQHPGRTPYALQCRYSKMLHGKPCEARDILSSRGYQFYIDGKGHTVARQLGNFTDEEEDMLLKLREEDHLDWDAIALELPGRTAEDLECRYDDMVREYLGDDRASKSKGKRKDHFKAKSKPRAARQNSEASERSRSRARYTPAEDDMILRLREDDKLGWQDIAKQMPERTLASIQRHYSRDIGPYGRGRSSTPRGSPAPGKAPVRPQKYTKEEDDKLMRLRDDEDLDWQDIAQQFPDRSASSLENRYYYKVRKDVSHTSSRASSVISRDDSYVSNSLPTTDLEAQLDSVETNAFSGGDNFTEAEDELIVKLRELECLSWDQIAAEMADRDVSSISCRYYQYLLPRKVPEVRGTNRGLDPALQAISSDAHPDTSGDADELAEVQEEQVYSANGSATAASSGMHKPASINPASIKSDAHPQRRAKAGRRSDAPMLRRALQKNLNRRSDSQLAANSTLGDMNLTTGGADGDALTDCDELSTNDSAPQLLPSALPADFDTQVPTADRHLRSSSKRKSTYPETPRRFANDPYPTSRPTPSDQALYVTPSKYQVQSHPYFVPNAAASEEVLEPAFSSKKSRRERASAGDDILHESEEEPDDEKVRCSSRKRRRAPRTNYPSPLRRTDDTEEDEDENDYEEDDDDETAGEYFTSRKKKRGSNKAKKSFRGKKPVAAPLQDDSNADIVAARTRAQTSDAEDETDEDDIEMPDLGTDDDETSSESEVEEEDDDNLRCKPRERSPLFDPRNTIEEAKKKKDAPPKPKPKPVSDVAKAGDGSTINDINSDIDVSSIPPEQLQRPDITWTQLNFLALRSRAPEPMLTREIYAYLKEHFPFFRVCKGHWRDSIRGNLSTRPEFVKGPGPKSSKWCLADPTNETMPMPKIVRNRRGDPDGDESKEPKKRRKPGRPSNASKGLPLKSDVKRKSVAAAEKKRLAASQHEEDAQTGGAAMMAESAAAPNRSAFLPFGNPNAPIASGAAQESASAFSPPPTNNAPASAGSSASSSFPALENDIGTRPTRPSTIADSEVDEHSDFVGSSSASRHAGTPKIKTETQPPASSFRVPTARMLPTLETNRGLSISKAAIDPPAAIGRLPAKATPYSIYPKIAPAAITSSSPVPSSLSVYDRLARTYGKETPGTARSTPFAAPVSSASKAAPAPVPVSSAIKTTPAFAHVMSASGSSRTGTPSTLRRTVQTPVKDTEGSEDELA